MVNNSGILGIRMIFIKLTLGEKKRGSGYIYTWRERACEISAEGEKEAAGVGLPIHLLRRPVRCYVTSVRILRFAGVFQSRGSPI